MKTEKNGPSIDPEPPVDKSHLWVLDGEPTATGAYWKCTVCPGVTYRSTRRGWLAYDGTFEMDFLLDGETVHAAGDGSTDAVIETADGPVRAQVGQTFVRAPDGRVEVMS